MKDKLSRTLTSLSMLSPLFAHKLPAREIADKPTFDETLPTLDDNPGSLYVEGDNPGEAISSAIEIAAAARQDGSQDTDEKAAVNANAGAPDVDPLVVTPSNPVALPGNDLPSSYPAAPLAGAPDFKTSGFAEPRNPAAKSAEVQHEDDLFVFSDSANPLDPKLLGTPGVLPGPGGTAGGSSPVTTPPSGGTFSITGQVVSDDGGLAYPQTSDSGPVVNLDQFNSDPRFFGIDGSGYAAVVLDTGIDLNHAFFGPDLDFNGVADRIVFHFDFADNDPDGSDFHGHGSNVSSIIGSEDGTHTGMAPGVNLIQLKVFPSAGGSGSFADIEAALQWVVTNAATFNIASVNMSLSDSGNYNTPQTLHGIDDELAAIAALDIITVSSSGNDFFNAGSAQGVAYPSADPNSLSVGATFDDDIGANKNFQGGSIAHTTGEDRLTPFSQRHDTLTDSFAPGSLITGANHLGGTVSFHGTSQAAPHISGIAVLAQQLAEQSLGRRLTLNEFAQLLNDTGVTINDGDDEDDNVTNTGLDFQRVDVLALGEAILAMVPPTNPTITIGDVSVVEGDNGTVDAIFTVSLSEISSADVTVDYDTSDLSATAGVDYNAVSDSLTIQAGLLSGTITVQVVGDTEFEPDETFTLTLSNPQGGSFASGATLDATGTIENDDSSGVPGLLFQESFEGTLQYTTVGEGSASVAQFWEVTEATNPLLNLNLSGEDGTFVFGGRKLSTDFGGQSGPGALRQVTFDEVDLSQHTGVTVTIGLSARDGTSYEDEDYVRLLASTDGGSQFTQLDEFVGAPGGGHGPLSNGSIVLTEALTDVSYSIADSETSVVFRVEAFNNSTGESLAFDNIRIEGISTPGGGPFLSITPADAVKPEGNSGTTPFTFTVTRSGDLSGPTDVNFQVSGGVTNPADPTDFGGQFPSGTVQFLASEASKTVTVDVSGDQVVEPDEEFSVTLSNPTGGALITTATATGTVVNDDASYSVVALDANKAEGNSGTTAFTFTVTRSGDTSGTDIVNYVVTGEGANPADASDFGGTLPSGNVTFNPSDTTQIISIDVSGDTNVEADEGFSVYIALPLPGSTSPFLSDPSLGILEMVAEEDSGLVEIDGLAFDNFGNLFGALEINGASGGVVYIDTSTGVVTNLVSNLPRADQIAFDPISGSLFVTSEVQPGSTTDRVFRLDPTYDASNVPISLLATSITTTIPINNPEGLVVLESTGAYGNAGELIVAEDISDGQIVHLTPTGTGSVLVDTSESLQRPEGMAFGDFNGAASAALFVAETSDDNVLRVESNGAVSVFGDPLSVGLNQPDNLEFGADGLLYVTEDSSNGRVIRISSVGTHSVFAEGFDNPQGLAVHPLTGDLYITEQDNESVYRVRFENDPALTASGTIVNDDSATTLSIAPLQAVKPEGDTGTTAYTFEVTRSGDVSGATDVDFAVTGGAAPAANPADFGGTFPLGTVNFIATETTQTLTVLVTGDTDEESDDEFTVTLSNATGGALITGATATGTIENDDSSGVPGLLFQESFEGTLQYTTVGEGSASVAQFWEVTEATNPLLNLNLSGEDGTFVFGGRKLSTDFGGQSGPGALRQVTFDEVDLSQHTGVTVTIGLSARDGTSYEDEDYVRLLASTDGGSQFTQLDEFVGAPGGGHGPLSNGSIVLTEALTDVSYSIADSETSVVFRVEAFNNSTGESLAFDNIRIEGVAAGGASVQDEILGTPGDDLLVDQPGNSVISGGEGDDMFVFADGGGHDVITDFSAGAASEDIIDLRTISSFGSFAAVQEQLSGQSASSDTVLPFGESSGLTLLGVNPAGLDSDDFLFS